jgi:Ca-activated chloride channel family protein
MQTALRSLLCCALFLSATPALADELSTIVGTVLDAGTKQPVPDVVITATSPSIQGEQTVVTDVQGQYRIPHLPPGVYVLRFEKESFKPFTRADIHLRPHRTIRVNVELLPSSFTEELVTTAAPPSIDVGSTTAGVSADEQFVRRIAVARPGGRGAAARSFESLAEVAPGTTSPENGYVVDGLSLEESAYGIHRSPESSNAPRSRAPAWALPHMPVLVPDGTPQTIYRAPPPPPPAPEYTRRPPEQPFDFAMYFQGHGVNPTVETEEERFSTFSVDVDTAAYSLARNYLERGALPHEQAVRVEEFVNTFDYGYSADTEAPFRVHVEGFPSPSRKGYHVLRLGLKAREVSAAQRKPSHLVFVIDVSGSMDIENRLGLVKRALRLLVGELDERDRVSIVVYGSTARVVLGPTRATQRELLLSAIDSLRAEGSTNAQAGMELGYALAAQNLLEGGINRIVLCSDGVANNGITTADGIWTRVKAQSARGITLSTVGFGMGNYNDVLMERLAQVGEGNYAYVDRLEEARRIFVQNLSGTLQVVAKDVKLQVEFDPATVLRYRLIGYENRMLRKEQFADDRVDAGEVGAGHAVTALYEVKLREPGASLGTLRLRYKAPEGGRSALVELPLPGAALRKSYGQATSATRLAYVAAAFAEKLRGSYWTRPLSWAQLVSLWEEVGTPMRNKPEVIELGELLRQARALDTREDRFEQFAPLATMDFDRPPSFNTGAARESAAASR